MPNGNSKWSSGSISAVEPYVGPVEVGVSDRAVEQFLPAGIILRMCRTSSAVGSLPVKHFPLQSKEASPSAGPLESDAVTADNMPYI